jgi:hypothetical protein
MSYAGVPVWIRISDAPATHSGAGGDKAIGKKRKRSFPWSYGLLKSATAARVAGATWLAITDQLIGKTGRQIGPDAVANRVLRFEEEEEEK